MKKYLFCTICLVIGAVSGRVYGQVPAPDSPPQDHDALTQAGSTEDSSTKGLYDRYKEAPGVLPLHSYISGIHFRVFIKKDLSIFVNEQVNNLFYRPVNATMEDTLLGLLQSISYVNYGKWGVRFNYPSVFLKLRRISSKQKHTARDFVDLSNILVHKSPYVRVRALEVVEKLNWRMANNHLLMSLVLLLPSSSFIVSWKALKLLGERFLPKDFYILRQMVSSVSNSDYPLIRTQMIRHLSYLISVADKKVASHEVILHDMKQLLHDRDKDVRVRVVQFFALTPHIPIEVRKGVLNTALNDPHPQVQQEAQRFSNMSFDNGFMVVNNGSAVPKLEKDSHVLDVSDKKATSSQEVSSKVPSPSCKQSFSL